MKFDSKLQTIDEDKEIEQDIIVKLTEQLDNMINNEFQRLDHNNNVFNIHTKYNYYDNTEKRIGKRYIKVLSEQLKLHLLFCGAYRSFTVNYFRLYNEINSIRVEFDIAPIQDPLTRPTIYNQLKKLLKI